MEKLAKELIFKKDWIFDPPPELFKQFEFRDLARLAIDELRSEHAMMKVREEAIEQALEIYQGYAGR